jgi:hypothetical protein
LWRPNRAPVGNQHTSTARLAGERLPVVVSLLQREASALSAQINPLDRALRRPAEALGAVPRT